MAGSGTAGPSGACAPKAAQAQATSRIGSVGRERLTLPIMRYAFLWCGMCEGIRKKLSVVMNAQPATNQKNRFTPGVGDNAK